MKQRMAKQNYCYYNQIFHAFLSRSHFDSTLEDLNRGHLVSPSLGSPACLQLQPRERNGSDGLIRPIPGRPLNRGPPPVPGPKPTTSLAFARPAEVVAAEEDEGFQPQPQPYQRNQYVEQHLYHCQQPQQQQHQDLHLPQQMQPVPYQLNNSGYPPLKPQNSFSPGAFGAGRSIKPLRK